jgi:serine/threonine protein kinase
VKVALKHVNLTAMGFKKGGPEEPVPLVLAQQRKETLTMLALDHPTIIRFIETFEELETNPAKVIIVMELVEGGDLLDFIQAKPTRSQYLPEEQSEQPLSHNPCFLASTVPKLPGKPKVGNLDQGVQIFTGGEQDVFCLQIAVRDVLR